MSRCSFSRRNRVVSTPDSISSIRKLLDSTRPASLSLPSPMRMAMMGEPPRPTREAKEDSRVTMGPHTPTPARARSPMPWILPM